MLKRERLRRPNRSRRTALAKALAAAVARDGRRTADGDDEASGSIRAPAEGEADGADGHPDGGHTGSGHADGGHTGSGHADGGHPGGGHTGGRIGGGRQAGNGEAGNGEAGGGDVGGWEAGRRLRDAIEVWLCGQRGARYQAVIDRLTGDWLELVAGQPGWDASSIDMLAGLAAEFGLAMQPDDTPGGTDDNALLAFASDPCVPPELAAQARAWRTRSRYGLWRVDTHPVSVPSGARLACTDILSGQRCHLAFPPRIRERLVRWTVWYGAAVPDDDGWHSTGLGSRLSPAEADAAAELILAGAAAATLGGTAEPAAEDAQRQLRRAMNFGAAEPHGVAVDYEQPFAEHVAITVSRMAGACIARVLGETYRYRASSPAPRNGSDEPACLIAARLAITSPEALRAALLRRDDFAVTRGNPAVFGWLESPAHRAPRVTLGTLRFADPKVTGRPEGTGWTGTTVLAQVNSSARFGYLLALLGKLDPGLRITAEKRVDPVLHTAWPAETRTERSASAEGWEEFWLDSPLAVLGHQSPRQAARGRYLPELVTLLRQFEYQAGLLTLEHKSGLDTRAMRRELGVTEPPSGPYPRTGHANRDGQEKRTRESQLCPFSSTGWNLCL